MGGIAAGGGRFIERTMSQRHPTPGATYPVRFGPVRVVRPVWAVCPGLPRFAAFVRFAAFAPVWAKCGGLYRLRPYGPFRTTKIFSYMGSANTQSPNPFFYASAQFNAQRLFLCKFSWGRKFFNPGESGEFYSIFNPSKGFPLALLEGFRLSHRQ